jgi:ABC-type polysaccharide/polyol phosphate export permease
MIVLPVMGGAANYPLLILLLLTSGFFASVLGLLIASLYQDIEKAFGLIFFLLILMMVPGIAYFIPGWDPTWVRILPSHPIIQGFKECIMGGGDTVYVMLASAGFLIVGWLLFVITNLRFKRTLSV